MQKLDLRLFFDALTDRIHPERIGHSHQLGEDDFSVFPFVKLSHEAHIELQKIEFDALKRVKGCVAASEIIHPYRKPKALEPPDLRAHEFKITAERTLRNLNGDHFPVKPRCIHAPSDLFNDIAGIEV